MIDLLNNDSELSMQSGDSNSSQLSSQQQRLPLQIKKGNSGDTYIRNLLWVPTNSAEELIGQLSDGLQKRHVEVTRMNDRSSRSHTIIYLKLKQKMTTSTVIFADLAGSERVERTQSAGQRFKEAQHINCSLAALGEVMQALSQKRAFVPYRNNKLTMLLQPGMGGNSKSVLFVCASPLEQCIGETTHSLLFGIRAKSVQNVSIKGLYE